MRPIDDIEQVRARYNVYLQVEKGLSANTAASYGDDVDKLLGYMAQSHKPVEEATLDDLETFVATLHDVGIAPRSTARIISGVKSFYKFLAAEGYTDSDPTRLLPAPKPGRHLPEVLSVDEIDRMIACIDMSSPLGQRNRAIIETLYGCGLRVSELTGLRISHIYSDEGYIIVDGKGDKQRLVPIDDIALEQIELYMKNTRSRQVVKRGNDDILFLNNRGSQLSRVMVFYIIKDLCERAGIDKTVVTRASPPPRSMCTSTAAACARRYCSTTPATATGHNSGYPDTLTQKQKPAQDLRDDWWSCTGIKLLLG